MPSVNVLVTVALEPELLDQIRSLDPRLDVRVLDRDEASVYWGRQPEQAAAAAEVRARLEAALAQAEVLFGFPPRLDLAAALAERLPRLRWFQATSAGVDRLLESGALRLLAERGVVVTNARGLHATPIGEYVMAAMLMFCKGAPRFIRAQAQRRWDRFMPLELRGKTVGIVGMGAIGSEVARLSKAFGCRVLAIRRSATARAGHEHADLVLPPSGLPFLLGESDFVVLATPLTPETRRLIGEPQLRAMKPAAYLINIGRGAIVDEAALVRALREGWIAGAALDVFEQEPLPPDSELWGLENLVISPHISGGTERYMQRAVAIFTGNLRRYLDGSPLENVVDPQRGY